MAAHARHTEPNANLSVAEAARSSAQEMSKYFGPLRNTDIETFASDAFAHETHNLPRAYVGRNKFLMATIDFLITKDDDWYTAHVLPWLYTEELHVKWNIWRFNRTMMDYEPEQGVPRYVSYESESRSDSLVRRGLAFIIEHGFYKTEIGRQHYLMNLKQIVEAVHETVYYGVIHELLAAPNFYQQWQHNHGRQHSLMQNDATVTLAEERWRFACVQKDVKGLFVLDAEIKDRMRRVGIEPDAWVFPSKMAIYASMVPEYFNEYSRGGAPATTALETGAKRFDTFRGNRVFETRSFDTDFMNAGATEPLTRHRQIGEYYVLGEHFEDYNHGMQIFDMSRDAFTTITHAEAIKHVQTGVGQDDGKKSVFRQMYEKYNSTNVTADNLPMRAILKRVLKNTTNVFHDNTASEQGQAWYRAFQAAFLSLHPAAGTASAMSRRMGELHTASDAASLLRAAFATQAWNAIDAQRFLESEHAATVLYNGTDESLLNFYDTIAKEFGIIAFPYKLLIFRPCMTYRMSTAILLKGGEELGQTLHGHHDFQLTDDVIHKTHIGHYTFYSKSVVRDPKLMYLAEDVYCSGYVGGENTAFVKGGAGDAAAYLQSGEMNPGSASLLVVPIGFTEEVQACMSLSGNLTDQNIHTNGAENSGSYSTWKSMGIDNAMLSPEAETKFMEGDEGEVGRNGVCFRGAQKRYHPTTGEWKTHTLNTGHWGPNVYDGCGMVRMGMYAHLKVI
jgi:hypothetical protein